MALYSAIRSGSNGGSVALHNCVLNRSKGSYDLKELYRIFVGLDLDRLINLWDWNP